MSATTSPKAVAATMIASAISASIIPYSVATEPRSSSSIGTTKPMSSDRSLVMMQRGLGPDTPPHIGLPVA